MCIIIAKDKKSRIPTEKELKNSFEYNNDGAGFMYVDNNKVVIDKGYMTWESFIKRYKTLLQKYNNFENKSLVIHCRIGTSGKNTKGNTHPYPITNNHRLLKTKKMSRLDVGIVHNGIIKDYGTRNGLNDTQEYISKFLYPIYKNYRDFYKNEGIRDGIEKMTGSKFAILDKSDKIYYIGDFIEDNGLKFSNNTYLDYSYSYGTKYAWYSDYYKDWYEDLYTRQKEEESKEETLYPLESNWYIDLYANGNVSPVGDNDYWFDYETLELYEYKDGDFHKLAINPIIYDERKLEVW